MSAVPDLKMNELWACVLILQFSATDARLLFQRLTDMRMELAAMINCGTLSSHDINLPFRTRVMAVTDEGPEGEAFINDREHNEDGAL